MKTSIKPILNYRIGPDGCRTLVLQIIYQRKRGVVFTHYRLLPEEFDADRGVVLAGNRTRAARAFAAEANAYITAQTEELRRIVAELESTNEVVHPTDITGLYRRRADRHYLNTFIDSLAEELIRQEKCGTAGNYRATLAAFEKFMGHQRCRLPDIDAVLLTRFVDYLRRVPVRSNTISFYIRCLRSIYNKARRAGLTSGGANPFDTVAVREDKTRKLAVDVDVMKMLAGRCLQEPQQALARDLFLFSFYARGMSFVDIAYLRTEQIRTGTLYYKRRKTGQPFSVKITGALSEIIERHAGCYPWVFPLMTDTEGQPLFAEQGESKADYAARLHKRYKVALSQYTQYLGEISEQLHLEKGLSFNVARHTWASLARDKGIPVSVISGSLGHSSEKTTTIYLDELDTNRIDEANDIVTAF